MLRIFRGVLVAAVVVGLFAGCAETPDGATRMVLVYFVRGETLAAATRTVASDAEAPERAMSELVEGPEAGERLQTAIPSETLLRGVAIDNGVATVDLSRSFEGGGGSLSIRLRVAQVVYTLTQFQTIQRVAFALDGTAVEAIGGEGIVVRPPVGQAAFQDLAPPRR